MAEPQPISPTDRVVIVASAFYSQPDRHGGSFSDGANSTSPDARFVDAVKRLAMHSPGLAVPGPHEVHFIHDLPLTSDAPEVAQRAWKASQRFAPLSFHRVEPGTMALPGAELRWQHAEELLRRLGRWGCAFFIDATDISVLHVPPCAEMAERVHIASDFCTGGWRVRQLLHSAWAANKPALEALSPARVKALSSWLRRGDAPTVNCGIVGGPRAAVEPVLRDVVAWLQRGWSGASVRDAYSDMLAWNEAALHLSAQATPVLSGYPTGPVNHPMHGVLCPAHVQELTRACGALGTRRPGQQCRMAWLRAQINATEAGPPTAKQLYWFGHKLPVGALRWYRALPRD